MVRKAGAENRCQKMERFMAPVSEACVMGISDDRTMFERNGLLTFGETTDFKLETQKACV